MLYVPALNCLLHILTLPFDDDSGCTAATMLTSAATRMNPHLLQAANGINPLAVVHSHYRRVSM